MSNNGKNAKAERLLRNRIARTIFAYAESIGISDRDIIEQLTDRVIERLEHVPTLPGMEHLTPITRRPVQDTEIQSMVRNILAEKKTEESPTAHALQEKPKKKTTRAVRKIEPVGTEAMKAKAAISSNARAVLERRYLVKDEKGKLIETAEDMFRRVAHHIASADLLDLVAYAKSKGLRPTLSTNGTLITPKMARKIMPRPPSRRSLPPPKNIPANIRQRQSARI